MREVPMVNGLLQRFQPEEGQYCGPGTGVHFRRGKKLKTADLPAQQGT